MTAHSLRNYDAIQASLATEEAIARLGPRPVAMPGHIGSGSGYSCNTDEQNKAVFDAAFAVVDAQRAWDREYRAALAKVKADLSRPLPVSTPEGLVWPDAAERNAA